MKIWAYIILAGMIFGGVGASYRAVYSAGYNKRDNELRNDAIEKQNAAIEKGIADWIATQEAAEAEIIIEERIVETIREVEKEIPVVVEKIVTVQPECNNLGDEFAGLLNKQINASNSNETSSADIAAIVVDGVSETQ